MTSDHEVASVPLAHGPVVYLRGGAGTPMVFLHHSISNHGWLPLYDQLSEQFEVFVPDMPGWGASARPEWARDVRDIAILMLAWMDAVGLDRPVLVGAGLGGWVAAEMATMSEGRFEQLILVGAAGLQPRAGVIADQLVIDYIDYIHMGFESETAFDDSFGEDPPREARQLLYGGREMTMRVTFKPWMFRHALAELLRNLRLPTTVVWGERDRIVPLECGQQYAELVPNARLSVIKGCGHFVDFERPSELAHEIRALTATAAR